MMFLFLHQAEQDETDGAVEASNYVTALDENGKTEVLRNEI